MSPGRPRSGGRRHPATRRPRLDGARLTAYDVLDGVSSRGAYANLLLPQLLRERPELDERDAAFATQLAYGTLRAQGTLDAILTGLVSRPLAELDPRVLDLLRLGTHQIVDLRVPSHAAVDTTVDLTRAVVGTGASGLVNAVLRKVAGGGDLPQHGVHQGRRPGPDDGPAQVHRRVDGGVRRHAEVDQLVGAQAEQVENAGVQLGQRPRD